MIEQDGHAEEQPKKKAVDWGARCLAIRKAKGWTQQECADAVGMSLAGWRRIEYGITKRPIKTIRIKIKGLWVEVKG